MGNSLFTGVGDLYNHGNRGGQNIRTQQKIFAGVVVDVCLDPNSSLYKSPMDVGKIIFRDPIKDFNKSETSIQKEAYPLDRSVLKYPVPGEEVIIFRAFGDNGSPDKQHATTEIFFYSFVVSVTHNVSLNLDPFIGTDAEHVDSSNPFYTEDQAKTRFDKKRKDINLSKESNDDIKIYKQLQPFEGDFILQGRFGNTIRFGSTSPKIETPWALNSSAPGVSGDGIMVLRVDRDYTTKEDDMITVEDINKDDSTITLCTSQRVELNLACSKELKTWRARYGLTDSADKKGTSNITQNKDTSQLWQKPIDTSQPAENAYQSPTE